ncbi:MAG: hypothetical protein RLZZ175_169 [Bacteroidota bacterium]|jgi:hypothetical protein
MLRKLSSILALSIYILSANAQNVSINTDGTAADASAMLEVKSTNSGFLAPRMTAAQRVAISSPATGLMVYQTDGTTGFYVYNGSWVKVLDASTDYLPLAGGTLTGTLNGTDAVFSSDISANTLTLGLGNSSVASNTAIGYHALNANTSGYENASLGYQSLVNNTDGVGNTGLGFQSLFHNTSGTYNTAIGDKSLHENTTGGSNISMGYLSLYTNTTGGNNVGLGLNALYSNETGANNVAVGHSAMSTNVIGTNNTTVGYQSDVFTGGLTNATAIGYGATVTTSNTIQLGNGSVTDVITSGKLTSTGLVSSNQVLINTSTPGIYMLDVVGDTRFTGSARVEGSDNTNNRASFVYVGGKPSPAVWETGVDVNSNGGGDFYFYQGGCCPRMIIDENGQLGLGTTTPSYALDVQNGDINASGSVRSAGVALTSDKRLKRNIIPLINSLGVIKQLNPVSYEKKFSNENTDYNKKEIGFIAQEIQQILPNLVTEGKDKDKILSVDYISLIPILTKSIQEQQAQIEAQQIQIEELKKLLEGLIKK